MSKKNPGQLRAAREAAGLTMSEAARESGTPYRTWQDWELGNRRTPGIAFTWLEMYAAGNRKDMKLLAHDTNILKEMFPEAMAFIHAAFLREEAYSLLCQKQAGSLNVWQEKRLAELLECPACQQLHFLGIIKNMR